MKLNTTGGGPLKKLHPLTAELLRPVGYRKDGRPIYPILGGDPTVEEKKEFTLTHSETISRMEEIAEETKRIAAKNTRSQADEDALRELDQNFGELDEHRKKLEAEEAAARMEHNISRLVRGRGPAGGGGPGVRAEGGAIGRGEYDRDAILEPDSIEDHRFRNPWKLDEMRTFGRDPESVARELHARSLAAAEKMQGASDTIRQTATQLIERWDDQDANLARLVLATSSPTYLRAWSKMAVNPVNADLSPEERAALNESKAAQRALSLTDANGGYLVPFQLDPTVILTSDGSYNEIRQIARQVVATGDVWNGVSAGAVAWSFDAEADEVSDDSPTFGGPAIPIRTARGFVPISLEARMDASNITQEVGRLLAQGKDDLEAIKFVTGTGVGNEPTGIITALTGVAASTVASTTADTYAFNDLYKVQGALPARHRRRASWLANNLFWNLVRQTAPEGIWKDPEGDRAGNLLGRPVYEAEAMDGTVDATVDNLMAVFGDFQNYVIADRIGMTVDFIPHLFGANRRPTGQSGWFAFYRVGAGTVNNAAFRVYNVT
jgi:HK97 family phage major capsid protein